MWHGAGSLYKNWMLFSFKSGFALEFYPSTYYLATKPHSFLHFYVFASHYQKALLLPCYHHLHLYTQNKQMKQWALTVNILVVPCISLNTISQSRQDYHFLGNQSMWHIRAKNMPESSPKLKRQGKRCTKASIKRIKQQTSTSRRNNQEQINYI